jgi:hypothetical protein
VEQDGRRVGGTFESVRGLRHTPDGEAVFIAKTDGAWSVMRGERQVGGRYKHLTNLTVSRTGSVAFVVSAEHKSIIIQDGKPAVTPLDGVTGLAFERDGKSLVVTAVDDGKVLLIRNGNRQTLDYEAVSQPRLSAESDLLYCWAYKDGAAVLLRNGQPVTDAHHIIDSWAVSPDGQSVAYVSKTEDRVFSVFKNRILIDGDLPTDGNVGRPVFAPNSEAVGYLVQSREKWSVRVDGRRCWEPIEAEAAKDLIFSPDGQSMACAVRRHDGWCVFVDGRVASEIFERIVGLKTAPSGDAIEFLSVRDGAAKHLRVAWK